MITKTHVLTDAQRTAIESLCRRYHQDFDPTAWAPVFDLPPGYVAGWVGHGPYRIYVGVGPEGDVNS